MTRLPPCLSLLLAAAVSGCGAPAGAALVELRSGIEGHATYGPITPVCYVGQPCDAPLSASFDVEREGERVARFHSDSSGHFLVYLPPGMYTIIPDSATPIMFPRLQRHEVSVAPGGLTETDLDFDTGIR